MSRPGPLLPWIAAACMGGILVLSVLAVLAVRAESRRYTLETLRSQAITAGNLMRSLHADRMILLGDLVRSPALIASTQALHGDPEDSAASASVHALLGPELLRMGIPHFLLVDRDYFAVAATDPTFVGRSTEPEPAWRERLETVGELYIPPYRAPRASTEDARLGRPSYFQLLCRSILDGAQRIGALCLATDPRSFVLPLLESSRSGATGEVYLVDREGRLRSPSRFEAAFEGDPNAFEPRQISRLYARVPPPRADGQPGLPLPRREDPLTRIAKQLLAERSATPIARHGYWNYRGQRVVGAALWISELDIGLIVEMDEAEAMQAALIATAWIAVLAAAAIAGLLTLAIKDRLARQRLALSEAQLSSFFSNAPISLHIQDREGTYLRVNPVYERYIGQPADELVGRRESDLKPLRDTLIARERREQRELVIHQRKTIQTVRRAHGADGRVMDLMLVRFPIVLDEGQSAVGMGSIGLDITAQVEASEALQRLATALEDQVALRTAELREARDDARAASRAKAEFLASMSHEIRTPLNAITGFSHLAAAQSTDPRVTHYLQRIGSSCQHLLGIVNGILDFSKLEAGQASLDKASFGLEPLVEEVAGLIGPRADEKGVELVVSIAPRTPLQLVGDVKKIAQVLINYLGNAVKFTDSGCISLRVSGHALADAKAELLFEVEDTGIGIPPDDQSRLFQPFQQVDAGQRRRFEGTGLGLAISQKLAELMGGTVAVRSQPGSGSVFSLTLTLDVVAAAAAKAPAPTGQRVLVVDDSPQARELLVYRLTLAGFAAEGCADARAALDRLLAIDADAGSAPPFALLIDERMPGTDGHQLAREVRRLTLQRSPPRLLLLAAAGSTVAHDPAVVDQVLRKPALASRVIAALAALPQASGVGAAGESPPDPDRPSLAGLQVLLVEDNAINREVAVDLLQLEGVAVTIAEDGMQALQRLREGRFDAVLMDVHMPVLDGIEATRLLREDPANRGLPVIGLSASVLEFDHRRCVAAGMDGFVAKPIVPAQLYAALRQHCGSGGELSEPAQAPASTELAGIDAARFAALCALPDLDVPRALQALLGRKALYLSLVRKAAPIRLAELATLPGLVADGDLTTAARVVHDIGSSAGSLGAFPLRERCLAVEALLRRGQLDHAAIDALQDHAHAEFSRLAIAAGVASAPSPAAGPPAEARSP